MPTPVEWLNEAQANAGSAATGGQSRPQIIALSNGNVLVAWEEDAAGTVAPGNGVDIVGVIFAADGTIVRAPFRLNNTALLSDENNFSIAATNDGGFVIAYVDQEGILPDSSDLVFERHNAAGNQTSFGVVAQESGATNSFSDPSVAVNLDDNSFMVSYNFALGTDDDIRARIFDSANSGVPEFNAATNSFEDDLDGQTALLTNGTYVTVYEEFDSGVAEIEFEINSATGSSIVLSTEISTGSSADPVVAGLTSGNWVVAWTDVANGSGNILFQLRRPDGVFATGIRIAADGANQQNEPVVIALPTGGFIIAWDDDTAGAFRARAFDAAGNADGDEVTIVTGDATQPDISVTADGRVLFAWQNNTTGEIFSSVWDPRGSTITTSDFRQNLPNFLETITVYGGIGATTIIGSDGVPDVIFGLGGADEILGGSDDDQIYGGGSGDTIVGGEGNDQLNGGEGDDVFIASDTSDFQANVNNGDGGNDEFALRDGAFLGQVFGGEGTLDALDGSSLVTTALSVNLASQTYAYVGIGGSFTIAGVEVVAGGEQGDALIGDNNANTLFGVGNNDTLTGAGGDDVLSGGDDDDTLFGGDGTDTLSGGSGNDRLVASDPGGNPDQNNGDEGNDTFVLSDTFFLGHINGGADTDLIDGTGTNFSLTIDLAVGTINDTAATFSVAGIENVNGSEATDTITGDGGDNVLNGAGGDDTLIGGDGNDTLIGGLGRDSLSGGIGSDDFGTITAATGFDDIDGGGGVNSVSFAGSTESFAYQSGEYTVEGTTYVLTQISNITFGSGNDEINVNDADLQFIDAGGGNDRVFLVSLSMTALGGAGRDLLDLAALAGPVNIDLDTAINQSDFEDVSVGEDFDLVRGNSQDNSLSGNGGDDRLIGKDGDDALFGGTGNDILEGGAGNDTLEGGDNNDLLFGDGHNDTLFGGNGNDILDGGDGTNILVGGAGNDVYVIASGTDQINEVGGQGTADAVDASVTFVLASDDSIERMTANNLGSGRIDLTGNGASQTITGHSGANSLSGLGGADTLSGLGGADALFGGSSNDRLEGGSGNDKLDGGSGVDALFGGEDDDNLGTITAANGFDALDGGTGIDRVAFAGADAVSVFLNSSQYRVGAGPFASLVAVEIVTTVSGNDTIQAVTDTVRVDAGSGNDTVFLRNLTTTAIGGTGIDTLELTLFTTNVTINLGTSTLHSGFENIVLGFGDDSATGTIGANVMDGAIGNDTLSGLGGDDTLFGGGGSNLLIGSSGNDTYVISSVTDLITEIGGEGTADRVDAFVSFALASNDDIERMDASTFAGGPIDLTGNGLAQTLTGHNGANSLSGLGGADTLFGGLGNDALFGGTEADRLEGGDGNDTLDGGAGVDQLFGGANDDDLGTITAATGFDLLDGSTGVDRVAFSGGDVVVSLDLELYQIGLSPGTGITGIEIVTTGSGNDGIEATAATQRIDAGTGDDIVALASLATTAIGGTGIDRLELDALTTNVVINLGTSAQHTGFENLDLGSGNDTATGSDVANRMFGGGGNDTLFGLGGDDSLGGAGGFNRVVGGTGNDTYFIASGGTFQIDEIAGEGTADQVQSGTDFALAANDDIEILGTLAPTGNDTVNLTGNGLAQTINGNDGANTLSGLAGTDTLFGRGGVDRLEGGDGNDILDGGLGVDSLFGGANDDNLGTISAATGLDALDGGTGIDRVVLVGINQFVDLVAGVYTLDNLPVAAITGVEIITTGSGDDTVLALADTVRVDLGGGDDRITLRNLTTTAIGGTGRDLLDLTAITTAITLNLGTSTRFTGFEFANLGSGADTGTGAATDDGFNGNAGNDTLFGGNGNDVLNGGDNDDRLFGGDHNDLFFGGSGNDRLEGGLGDDNMSGDSGNDTLFGGDGNDFITEQGGDNTLDGGNGDDSLIGASGRETIFGGLGNDYLVGSQGNDVFDGGDGNDTIFANQDSDTVFGGDGNDYIQDTLTGATTSISGGTGNDLFDLGGIGTGGTLDGGTGRDTLNALTALNLAPLTITGIEVLQTGAGVTARAAQLASFGEIRVNTTATGTVLLTLAATGAATTLNLAAALAVGGQRAVTLLGSTDNETLTLSGGADSVDGGGGNDALAGGSGADILRGGAGNDTLTGGNDADQIFGGANNDRINVSDLGDTSVDGGTGTDTLVVNMIGGHSFDMATGTITNGGPALALRWLNFENYLNGAGGASSETVRGTDGANTISFAGTTGRHLMDGRGGADTLIGGSAADSLIGGTGDDVLDGGAGNDILIGGAGNDTYIVDAAGDQVFETTTTASTINAGGIDTVQSSVSFNLDATAGVRFVNNLTLTGTGNTNGTGNALANVLTGNAGNNTLNGGLGADTLIGGAGNDTYIVDAAGDRVFETTTTASTINAGGIDTVQSSVTFDLDATAGVRFVNNLTLTGTAAINGTGNALANVLTGNAGNNTLNGGLGADTLSGGAGNDTFLFNTVRGAGNVDRITDFTVIDDTIRLDDTIFVGLATGDLAATAFVANLTGTATDGLDRIIYETNTGRLYFDADGSGASARVHFATLSLNLALTSADFFVF